MSRKLKIGSLFAGIGGFDLGLERTGGFETAWFCEQADYPTKILNQRWPGVPVYPDVTELKGNEIEPVDILVGGFPCQDISAAGRGAGITGARSGLWSEFARLIGELRPRYVIAENSPLLKTRGLNTVLGSLAAIGYDAEWDCIPACAVGAHHQRDRIWVVAYPRESDSSTASLAREMADAAGQRQSRSGEPKHPCDSTSPSERETAQPFDGGFAQVGGAEPRVGGMAHGVSGRVDRELGVPSTPRSDGQPPEAGERETGSAADAGGAACGLGEHRAGRQGRETGDPRALPVARPGDGPGDAEGHSACDRTGYVADTDDKGLGRGQQLAESGESPREMACDERHETLADPDSGGRDRRPGEISEAERWGELAYRGCGSGAGSQPWTPEPDLPRVAHGIPNRVDRTKALGNALVPDIPEWLGYRILEWEAGQ